MHSGDIVAVTYRVASTAVSATESCASVRNDATYEMGEAKQNGLFDPHMGTTDSDYRCKTCAQSKDRCHGHPGFYRLKYPCMNPNFVQEIRKWLRIICFQCGNPVFSTAEISAIHVSDKLEYFSKAISGVRECAHCNTPHPIIKQDQLKYAFSVHSTEGSNTGADAMIYPHDIVNIFGRISNETVVSLGRSPISHPRSLILEGITIPPPMTRPDMKRLGSSRASNNDATTAALRNFIKHHSRNITDAVPALIDAKYAQELETMHVKLVELMTSNSEDQKSIAAKIKGKEGRLRGNLLGKRVFNMARATIDGDPRLNLDQLSMPIHFARTLQVQETIWDFNRDRLNTFIVNGMNQYPGCSRIIKRGSKKSYKPNAANLIIENGDIIVRDLVDGDVVSFNRQPSLMMSNITTFRVVIDHNAWSIGMNDITCALFGADFDGDQMNILAYEGEAARNEIRSLTMVADRAISMTSGTVSIGLVEDSKIGSTKITQSGVVLDKYHAMLCFATMTALPSFGDVPIDVIRSGRDSALTGRDLVSMITSRTPVDLVGKSKYYDPNDAPWMQWVGSAPNDATIEFKGGRLVRGCLDGGIVGSGSGLFHAIARDYGTQRAIDTIFDMQQLAINYTMQHGMTTGMRDLLLSPEAKQQISAIINDLLLQADINHRRLLRNEIIPPVGQTVTQFYESMQINTLKVLDEFVQPIFQSIADGRDVNMPAIDVLKNNGAFEMMASGSKGSMQYFTNMCACIGLTLLNGERVANNFGYGRAMVYYPRFDESPASRGFSSSNYIQGMTCTEYIHNSMQARAEIIAKALMTSVTGEQNAKSVKSLESIITNNYGWTTKGDTIVSFAYGEDYFDPRSIANVTYGPALISDEAFTKTFKYVADDAKYQNIFDGELDQIRNDRNAYRARMKVLENQGMARDKLSATIKLPFNIPRIIGDIIRDTVDASGDASPSNTKADADAKYKQAKEMIDEFCIEAPYLFINEIQRKKKGYVPRFVESAATLIRMYVHAELCCAKVRAALVKEKATISPEKLVAAALERIRTIVVLAIIDPGTAVGIIGGQSFSEPFTQLMLDSYKAGSDGVPAKSKVSKCREIMSARDVDRLSNASMLVMLTPDYNQSAESAQIIATKLEMVKLSQIIGSYQIFYEHFGEPVHPAYVHEAETVYAEFAKNNPLIAKPPGGLIPWCIRYEMNKSMLVMKNIDMSAIVMRLREIYPGVHFVYTNERAATVVLRVHPTSSARLTATGKGARRGGTSGHGAAIASFNETLMGTIVRGVDRILQARVEKITRTKIETADGPNKGAIVDDVQYCVRTQGTNLPKVCLVDGVVPELTQTDAVKEYAHILGIASARVRIITEMKKLVEKCNVRHYMLYADEMTRSGIVTSIDRSGLRQREVSNVSLRAGQASPIQVLADAAIHARREVVGGISSPLILGNTPKIGTRYNTFAMDPEIIVKYRKDAAKELDEL